MKHTFAISAYLDSPYLEECVISLRNQTVKSDIIICTSTPCAHIEAIASKYGLPLYVRDGESSLMDDWNFAVEKAVTETKAQFVTVAHQDDIYEQNYAKVLQIVYRRYPDLTLFCSAYRNIDSEGRLMKLGSEKIKKILRNGLRLRKLAHTRFIKRSALIWGNAICCPSCAYNIEKIGLPLFKYDRHFVTDWLNLLDIAELEGRFICSERELVDHRIHDGAATKRCIEDNSREKEEYEVFKRVWPRPLAWLLMRFYRLEYKSYESPALPDATIPSPSQDPAGLSDSPDKNAAG